MKVKQLIAVFLSALLLVVVVGCSQAQDTQTASTSDSQTTTTADPATTTPEKRADFTFTDDAGRDVEVPGDMQRIAPSGPLAQLVLYTLCPDRLVGLGQEVTDAQLPYIDSDYAKLPVFGNFYGDTLNLESVLAAGTQIVIDIGEAKETVTEDMQGVQDKTGIPSVFINMELDNMADAYRKLGELVDETERAEELATYIETTLADTKKAVDAIPQADRKKVYYGQDSGTTAVIAGTVHGDVIDMAGGINVAEVEETIRGGISGVIGFVGLIIPHFARMVAGYDYRTTMPVSMLMGAAFLMLVDCVSRSLVTAEIPIGILTAFIGAPFFVYLILDRGNRI